MYSFGAFCLYYDSLIITIIGSTGGIRTHTELILSQVSPAFGLPCHMVGQAGIEPAYEKFIRLPDATSLPFVRNSQQKLGMMFF